MPHHREPIQLEILATNACNWYTHTLRNLVGDTVFEYWLFDPKGLAATAFFIVILIYTGWYARSWRETKGVQTRERVQTENVQTESVQTERVQTERVQTERVQTEHVQAEAKTPTRELSDTPVVRPVVSSPEGGGPEETEKVDWPAFFRNNGLSLNAAQSLSNAGAQVADPTLSVHDEESNGQNVSEPIVGKDDKHYDLFHRASREELDQKEKEKEAKDGGKKVV